VRLVLRLPGPPVEDLDIGDRVLTIGSDVTADVRVEGPVAPVHLRIDTQTIEAIATCDVGGVMLRAGSRRTAVPCVITLGETTLELRASAVSAVATRDLALQALEDPELLWPSIVVVEGPGLGKELILREERVHVIGRARGCDLVLDDLEVTREHVEVRRRHGRVQVLDRRSTRGTWIGRRRLEPGRQAIWPTARMLRIGSSVLALIAPVAIPELDVRVGSEPEVDPSPPLERRSDSSPPPSASSPPPSASSARSSTIAQRDDASPVVAMDAFRENPTPPMPARKMGIVFVSVAALLVAIILAVLISSFYVLMG